MSIDIPIHIEIKAPESLGGAVTSVIDGNAGPIKGTVGFQGRLLPFNASGSSFLLFSLCLRPLKPFLVITYL